MEPDPKAVESPKAVLARARAILGAFDAHTPSLGLNELTRRSGLPKATTHRLATSLVECGLLDREGRRYRLGRWLFELGQRAPAHRSLRLASAPFLEDLSRATGETALLTLPGQDEILFGEKYVGARGRGQIATMVEGRVPLNCSASGKIALAFGDPANAERFVNGELTKSTPFTMTAPDQLRAEIERVHELGYAVERQELVVGSGAVAAPVFRNSQLVACLTVVAPISRLDIARFAPAVLLAGRALSRALGGGPAQVVR
ncbi:IclR family transcriptional regulator [Sinomonas terrae]|uniref:IclR family transcriptional regulator n=1 Tax=Sinomonas terrae TaxID=2908838 RepID=A0ABS9U4H1_9MICC|nr:IclR family transcriptional regulator [Sinomonas terrae]MCH6471586.1 IclR family transcriptional regulator [Sinomonas terrae]